MFKQYCQKARQVLEEELSDELDTLLAKRLDFLLTYLETLPMASTKWDACSVALDTRDALPTEQEFFDNLRHSMETYEDYCGYLNDRVWARMEEPLQRMFADTTLKVVPMYITNAEAMDLMNDPETMYMRIDMRSTIPL